MRKLSKRITAAALWGGLALSGSALAAPTPELTSAEAQRRLQDGDRAGALKLYEQLALQRPDDSRLWQRVGDLRFGQQSIAPALEAWTRALELAPNRVSLQERVTHAAMALGDYESALETQRQLVEQLRRSPGARFQRNLLLLSELGVLAGDFSTGEDTARELMKRAPDQVTGRLALAYVHLHAAEYEAAADRYREVLAIEPGNMIALNNIGNTYYMRRDLDTAAEFFETVLEQPKLTKRAESLALANLAELLQLQGGGKHAQGLYQDAIEAKPDAAWGHMGLASLLDSEGQYDAAVEAMIDGWERDQSRMTRLNMHFFAPEWAWQTDALLAEIEGDVERAERLWTRILKGDLDRLHPSAAFHLRALSEL